MATIDFEGIRPFFNETLPALLTRITHVKGSITWLVPTVGEWQILLSGKNSKIEERRWLKADAMEISTPDVFLALFDGKVPVTGEGFGLFGDSALIRKFLSALQGPSSMLGVRANSSSRK